MAPSPGPSPVPSEFPTAPPTVPLPVVTFGLQESCKQVDFTKFNICLDLVSLSGVKEDWMDSFGSAQARWEEAITGDLQSISRFTPPADDIGTEFPAVLDDLYIKGAELSIDGAGGVLGRAGPRFIRSLSGLTVSGIMEFDSEDIQSLIINGQWEGVILHGEYTFSFATKIDTVLHLSNNANHCLLFPEMGHVLGIGTLWRRLGLNDGVQCVGDDCTCELEYGSGTFAEQEWQNICGEGAILPIECDGGPGTAGSHFDEACLRNELMTGFVDFDMRLSKITIGSLRDIGYQVDLTKADPFGIENLGSVNGLGPGSACGANYCPNAPSSRRALRPGRKSSSKSKKGRDKKERKDRDQQTKRPVDDETLDKIYLDAYRGMKKAKEERSNSSMHQDKDILFVGDQVISILYLDAFDPAEPRIIEKTVTWDAVLEWMESRGITI